MSRENVEVVMSTYAAVQQAEYESGFEVLDEEILWDMSGLGLPDLGKVYRGHDGIREFWTSWLAAWEMIEFKTLDVDDQGEHVIVEVQQRNRGRASTTSARAAETCIPIRSNTAPRASGSPDHVHDNWAQPAPGLSPYSHAPCAA